MTRIIAGFAGSLRLAVPASGTRPTSDRVREAIFSALSARDAIEFATALDLFAGSGALGLEAASRGASHVTLVERDKRAAAMCRTNAAKVLAAVPTDARPEIVTVAQSVQSFLAGALAPESGIHPGVAGWDLAFLDPPYDLGEAELAQALETLAPLLSPAAMVVLERGARAPEPRLPDGLELERRKVYGDTAVYWLGSGAAESAV